MLLTLLTTTTLAQDDAKASNNSLLWGPYRPNLYFGVRPRLPKSLMTGLMWSRVEDFTQVQQNIRHTCEQHEGMSGYGWDAYDPRTGGVQVIHDSGNGIDLTTSFVKFPEKGGNGGSWGARIKGVPREEGSSDMKTAVWFYAGVEGLGSLEIDVNDSEDGDVGFNEDVALNGQTNDLGDFKLEITAGKNEHPGSGSHPAYQNKPLDRTFVHSLQIPEEALWQAKRE